MIKRLIITNHAKQRIIEAGLSPSIIIGKFGNAKRIKIKYGRKIYKNIKYGKVSDEIDYYHCAGCLYTVLVKPDYFLLLTITKYPRKKVKYKRD